MKILVTGASGFVGSYLIKQLSERSNQQILGVSRTKKDHPSSNIQYLTVDNIDKETNWHDLLTDVNVIVHLAARAHVMNESLKDPLSEYRKVNTEGTANLAKQAAAAGVKRFIFLSSIKALGEQTKPGQPFSCQTPYNPSDDYGVSKMEAEQELQQICSTNTMDFVIIRPPLIYGPGVKANFRNMMLGINKRIPLPLGCIQNKRSLVSIGNLSNLIRTCIEHPSAKNNIFLVSDDLDISTPELATNIGESLERKAIIFKAPLFALRLIAKLFKKEMAIQRLCGSLQVDISKTKKELNWTPPLSMKESLRETAQAFLSNKEETK